MFANKIVIFALLAATIASAAPGGEPDGGSTSNVWNKTEQKCNVGTLECCKQVQTAKDANQNKVLSAVGLVLPSVAGLVGINCNPIDVLIGVSGNSCSAQPACCKGNTLGGVATVGCTPVNLNA